MPYCVKLDEYLLRVDGAGYKGRFTTLALCQGIIVHLRPPTCHQCYQAECFDDVYILFLRYSLSAYIKNRTEESVNSSELVNQYNWTVGRKGIAMRQDAAD